ncbi:MAG: hypothetical protein J7L89_03920, partial [Bacteroidales bacterium]|nr:hypothetical protein [Bacteroidales bacterium]
MKKIVFLVTACLVSITSMSQQSKPPLDFSVYDQWNSVSGSQLDNRGHWISYEIKPAVGDGMLYLRNWTGDSVYTFARGSSARIAPLADFLVFRIKVQHDSLRQAKLDKLKPDRMPKDSLGIYIMATGKLMKYPKLKSFKVAGENSHWMAYQLDEKPTAPNDTAKSKKKSKKKIYKGISLHLIEPATGNTKLFKEVTEYGFSKNGHWLYMVSIHEDSVNTSTVRIFNTETARSRIAFTAEGVIKKIVSDEKATQLAFLWSQDTTKQKIYSLGYWSEKKPETKILVDTLTEGLKPGWCVSEHGRIYFSENGKRLFLGLVPKPKIEADKKDSLLKEEKVFLDIWHWQDVVIQPMQLKQVSRERNKSYQAVVLLKKRKLIPLTGPDLIENIKINQKGNGDVGLSLVNQPYKLENAVNFTHFKDVYLTDVNTGNSRIIFSDVSFNPSLSPTGKYLYWWQPNDSCWYSYDVRTAVTRNLTGDLDASFVRETDDRPEAPGNYGVMGWSKEDADLFLYDKHNIWKINPAEGGGVNVTAALVKDENLRFRYLRMDPEETYITTGRKLLFSVFNTHNKQSGFYRFSLDQPVPGRLILDDCSFGRPKKAKSVDKLLWTRTTVSEYPDLWISTFDFKDARKITHANPQQSRYNWVTVELVEWKDFDGITHQGMLYKPEDFDPLKKYPMMVYFYERLSDNLHRYIIP